MLLPPSDADFFVCVFHFRFF